jgi:hypothetical protein
MSKNSKCINCGSGTRGWHLCHDCMEKDGRKHTASNFDLKDLSIIERQLVFLWACGQDISEYFEKESVPAVPGIDEDVYDLLNGTRKRKRYYRGGIK